MFVSSSTLSKIQHTKHLLHCSEVEEEEEAATNDEPAVVDDDKNVEEEEAADAPVIVDEEDDDGECIREDWPGIEAVDSEDSDL